MSKTQMRSKKRQNQMKQHGSLSKMSGKVSKINNHQMTNKPLSNMENISVRTVDAKILKNDDLILDIRSHIQHGFIALKQPHWHIESADVDPKTFIKDFALDGKKTLYIICNSGHQSIEKARAFIQAGFKNVASVIGGMNAAKSAGLSMIEHPMGYIQKQVPLTAGIGILIGLIGGMMISGWFYLLPFMIGMGLITWGITGECTIEKILKYMPWNQNKKM